MEIKEPYKRILNALNLEKHLTASQLTLILYPKENQNRQEKAYQRVSKNLQYLRGIKLLKSKSYGLGKDYLWSLTNNKINLELELEPPKSEVHTFKYEHEKFCGDIFVQMLLSGRLYGWEKRKISKGIIPDRVFYLDDTLYFLEAETGSQKEPIIREKVSAYKQYFRETRQEFSVIFVTKNDDLSMFESALKGEIKSFYGAVSYSQLASITRSNM